MQSIKIKLTKPNKVEDQNQNGTAEILSHSADTSLIARALSAKPVDDQPYSYPFDPNTAQLFNIKLTSLTRTINVPTYGTIEEAINRSRFLAKELSFYTASLVSIYYKDEVVYQCDKLDSVGRYDMMETTFTIKRRYRKDRVVRITCRACFSSLLRGTKLYQKLAKKSSRTDINHYSIVTYAKANTDLGFFPRLDKHFLIEDLSDENNIRLEKF